MSTGVIGSKPTLMPVFLEETAPVVAKIQETGQRKEKLINNQQQAGQCWVVRWQGQEENKWWTDMLISCQSFSRKGSIPWLEEVTFCLPSKETEHVGTGFPKERPKLQWSGSIRTRPDASVLQACHCLLLALITVIRTLLQRAHVFSSGRI